MKEALSSSQRTFRRESDALAKIPTGSGAAACADDKRFDVLAEKDTIAREIRNQLARVCAGCALTDCGWRQTVRLAGYTKTADRKPRNG